MIQKETVKYDLLKTPSLKSSVICYYGILSSDFRNTKYVENCHPEITGLYSGQGTFSVLSALFFGFLQSEVFFQGGMQLPHLPLLLFYLHLCSHVFCSFRYLALRE